MRIKQTSVYRIRQTVPGMLQDILAVVFICKMRAPVVLQDLSALLTEKLTISKSAIFLCFLCTSAPSNSFQTSYR